MIIKISQVIFGEFQGMLYLCELNWRLTKG